MITFINRKSEEGYIAISLIIMLSVIILGIIVTVGRLGIGEGQVSLALSKGEETLAFVEGCAEDALLKSRADANFSGGSITLPEGSCDIAISKISTPWIMTATTSSISYKRTIEIKYTRNPTGITLSSWKEI